MNQVPETEALFAMARDCERELESGYQTNTAISPCEDPIELSIADVPPFLADLRNILSIEIEKKHSDWSMWCGIGFKEKNRKGYSGTNWKKASWWHGLVSRIFSNPEILRNIIHFLAHFLRMKMLDGIKTTKKFSLLADESSLLDRTRCLSISGRITATDTLSTDVFLDLIQIKETATGENLSKIVLERLQKLGLDREFL